MTGHSRGRLAEELPRRLAAALRSAQLYAPSHPLVARSLAGLHEALQLLHVSTPSLAIGLVGDELVVGDAPVPRAGDTMGELMRRLQQAGIERIVIDRGVEAGELGALVHAVARTEPGRRLAVPTLAHVRVGRLQVESRVDAADGDAAVFRQAYADAVAIAARLWESAATEGRPDATAARGVVDSLAQAAAQNRTAMLALTALKQHDNYTFTHMVNVSILAMAQARGLGLEGAPLRDVGMAGLMHDIGKVKTPPEILNKPEGLTEGEFDILRRHTVDGAEILRLTPDISPLAAIVAFEHHLRADGTGYPRGVSRASLNLATTLCGIADVYDAMRSRRIYQKAFPTDRILAVLQRNDGRQFDQHLVRRFAQLVGIYPAGTLVRLTTGEIAVVLKAHAPDPHRPRVRILFDADGSRREQPCDLNLWDQADEGAAVQQPLDPAAHDVDTLHHVVGSRP